MGLSKVKLGSSFGMQSSDFKQLVYPKIMLLVII